MPLTSPLHTDLVQASDYLHTATDLHAIAAGAGACRISGKPAEWFPKVRGTAEDGAVVGVAWYEISYDTRADAMKRARQMLQHVKAIRAANEKEIVTSQNSYCVR